MNSNSLEKPLLAILSGLMLTAGFPPAMAPWIHWVALVPLLQALKEQAPYQAFRIGLLAGLTHYLTLIYWIILVLGHYGGLNLFLSLGILLLFSLYLSLFPAFFSLLAVQFRGSLLAVFLTGGAWVALEYVRAKALTGFPWCLLGYSQYRNLQLIQTADLVGVYGTSFLLVLANLVIYSLLFDRRFSKKESLPWEVFFVAILLVTALFYGQWRLSEPGVPGTSREPVRVAIIQGNVDQSLKWDPDYQEETLSLYERLTHKTFAFEPDLIVWPETAMPFFFQEESPYSRRVVQVARSSQADLVFGSPAYERHHGTLSYFNRAFSLSGEGTLIGQYDKMHLVPFGEYVPLKRIFPFIHRLVPAAGDFSAGSQAVPFALSSVHSGILICFEVIFPELAQKQVKAGAELLINMTNDAWFGMTSAPYQHMAMAVFRAVETRRPLIRAANTGISTFISPWGEILARSGLFQEEILAKEIPLPGSFLSPYTRFGDAFPLIILLICLIKIFIVLCYTKTGKRYGKGKKKETVKPPLPMRSP